MRHPHVRVVTVKAEKTEYSNNREDIDIYPVAHEQVTYRQTVQQEEQEKREYARPGVQYTVPRELNPRPYCRYQGCKGGICPYHSP